MVWWIALPALAVSLGWALRGFIGGGPLGAMIPGAIAGLVLCRMLGRERDAATVAAFAAVGVGFGGEMTYGQTVGLSLRPETYWWALLGFLVKGGAWGLLGGATTGLGLTRERYRPMQAGAALALLVAGTWAGWRFINEPKLVYFSDRLNKSRPEVWAGLIVGALAMLLWLRGRIAWRFAGWGAAGGGAGFAIGAAIQVWGKGTFGEFPLGWWKVMELTFGALLGAGFGMAAWRSRTELDAKPGAAESVGWGAAILPAAAAIAGGIVLERYLETRFNFVIAGAVLLAASLGWRALRWQIAITVTQCAFVLDLMKNRPHWAAWAMWSLVVASSLAAVAATVRIPRVRPLLLWLMWGAVGVSVVKSFVPWVGWGPLEMEGLFVVMAAGVSWMSASRGA